MTMPWTFTHKAPGMFHPLMGKAGGGAIIEWAGHIPQATFLDTPPELFNSKTFRKCTPSIRAAVQEDAMHL